MNSVLKVAAFLCIASWLSSCESAQKKEETTEVDQVESSVNEEEVETSDETSGQREPNEDEIREYGKVVGLEDGPYPLFILSMEFPERQTFVDFNLNIESINLGVEELNNLQNKYVTLYYTSELDVNLQDLKLDNVSILGDDAFMLDNAKQLTGILSGAEKETGSDLPGKITITPAEGKPLTMDWYVTAEMTSANNKEVTAFYSTRGIEWVTYLEPSTD